MRKEEFLNYVIIGIEDECWLWIGATNGRGYGRLEYERVYQQAHRVSFKIFCHEIPRDINVLHNCDNTICVNPKHLFLGTQQDNVNDMIAKDRASFAGDRPLIGSQHPRALLNEEQVRDIKKMLINGYRHRDIADHYGVARQTITNISTGQKWSHI